MYQARFRHRNVLQSEGASPLENYVQQSGGTCTAPKLAWVPYYTVPATISQVKVDTIDDIAGDAPRKNQGVAGFKFHPMTRVKGELVGGSDVSWSSRLNAFNCTSGQPGYHQTAFRRLGTSYNTSRDWSGFSLPMLGDRLDMSKVNFPWEKAAQLRVLAETACLAERGTYGESNLYESLAEINKTVGMLKDIFDRARRIQNIAFGGKRGASRLRALTNETAGQYLLTRYGFMPTIKDIEAILVGLEKPLGSMLKTTRKVETWTNQQTVSLSPIDEAGSMRYNRSVTSTESLRVKAMSLDQVDVTMMGALGLGIKDLVSVPWELKSHSFVLDWFGNVGDLLSAIVPDVGISNIGQCVVTEWSRVETCSFTAAGFAPGAGSGMTILSQNAPAPISRTITYKNRDVGALRPRLALRSDFKFDRPLRALDALSLLIGETAKVQADLQKTEMEKIIQLRRRQGSRKGVRSADDFRNLT